MAPQVKPRPPPAEPQADDPAQRHRRGFINTGYSIVSIGALQSWQFAA